MADKNRATNEAAYEAWVRSYTPLQIREANSARRALARDPTRKTRLFLIKDDRLVKRPTSPFLMFSKENSSGADFKDMASAQVDAAKKWHSLSESEKEVSHLFCGVIALYQNPDVPRLLTCHLL